MDEQKEGSGLRSFAFLCLCTLLVFLGFQAFGAHHPLIGLMLWAAGPITWAIAESNIKKQVAKRVWQEENQPYTPPPAVERAPEPEQENSLEAAMEALRGFFSAGDFRLGFSAIKDGESLEEWCERTASAFPAAESAIGKPEIRELLISAVKLRRPKPGEPVALWFDCTIERMREVANNLSTNLFGPESGRQKGESNLQWLSRVGPLFLNVKDGESKDDVIEALAGIADKAPPKKAESFMAWFERVRLLIDEHNAQTDEAT